MLEDASEAQISNAQGGAPQGSNDTEKHFLDTAQSSDKRTVITFLREHQESFDVLPFGSVDSLILSTLAYLELSSYDLASVTGDTPVPLVDIARFMPLDTLACHGWIAKSERLKDFLLAVACSRRFRDLTVSNFESDYSYKGDTQFAAVTFHVAGIHYVAFRGTDGSIAGWNEDFNMAYLPETPGQVDALNYLTAALGRYPERSVYVGGHSKGGNLAEYAAMMLDDERFSQVAGIFNHDGPGFLQAPSARWENPIYRGLLHKTVPGFSVVGLLMENHSDYRIVKSDGVAMGQHEPLNWQVADEDFAPLTEVAASARLLVSVLFEWLSDLAPEQRELVIETVFEMLEAEDSESFSQLASSVPHTVKMLVREAGQLDEETQDSLKHALYKLGGTMASGTKQQLSDMLGGLFQTKPETQPK